MKVGKIWATTGKLWFIRQGQKFCLVTGHLQTLKQLLRGFFPCRERGIIFTRGIRFYVSTLTGRCCVLLHPAQPNGRQTLSRVLLPIGRRPEVTKFLFPSHTFLLLKYCIFVRETNKNILIKMKEIKTVTHTIVQKHETLITMIYN